MVLGHPLFPGESSVDQMVEIVKVLGSPSKNDIQVMNPNYTDYKFPDIRPITFKRVFRDNTPDEVVLFLQKLLKYNPNER